MQCPYVCIIDSDPGLVGCLIYFEDHNGSRIESYFKGTCKTFLCAAWYELTDRQILFAAEMMKDWVYYSLLIKSLEILTDLTVEYDHPKDVPDEILQELKIDLIKSLMEDDLI